MKPTFKKLSIQSKNTGINSCYFQYMLFIKRAKFGLSLPNCLIRRYGTHPNVVKEKHIRYYGQPTHNTHPHLLKANDVTPGISKDEYSDRRYKFLECVVRNVKNKDISNNIFIFPSALKTYMTHDIPYVFRQNSNFLYLCGFQEPNSALVLINKPEKNLPEHKPVLFVPKRNPNTELWDGPRSGADGTSEITGIKNVFHIEELETFIESFAKNKQNLALWYDYTDAQHVGISKIVTNLISQNKQIKLENPKYLIQELRLFKSPSEIELMKKCCEIASESFIEVMKISHPGISESYLWAKMDFECRIRTAEYLAYPPVVAGGNRANTIHYINNNQIIHNEEMVLIDAGCEYHGYASDITRTWPVSGYFTPEQLELYELVLETQKELLKECSNLPSLDFLFHKMCELLGIRLRKIGLLPVMLSDNHLSKAAHVFCPHHVGHYLGMDVHDTADVSRNLKLQPGMVITIEPGIYINDMDKKVPYNYRGIGVRIEDDVLITENGPHILTSKCPKEVSDLKKIISQKK